MRLVAVRSRPQRRRLYLQYWNVISIGLIALVLAVRVAGTRLPLEMSLVVLGFWLVGHIYLHAILRR